MPMAKTQSFMASRLFAASRLSSSRSAFVLNRTRVSLFLPVSVIFDTYYEHNIYACRIVYYLHQIEANLSKYLVTACKTFNFQRS